MAKATTKKASGKTKLKKFKKRPPTSLGEKYQANYQEFRLCVAAVTDSGELVTKSQTASNGPFAKSWTAVNKNKYENVAAASTSDGRVALVAAQAGTQNIHYIVERPAGSSGKGRWTTPVNLGLPRSAPAFSQLVLVRDSFGLDNVFGICPNAGSSSVWWKHRNPDVIVNKKVKVVPPGQKKPVTITVPVSQPPKQAWSDWEDIGTNKVHGIASITAANNGNGSIVLATISSDGVRSCQQTHDANGKPNGWTKWTVPGDLPDANALKVSGVLGADNQLSLFASTQYGVLRSSQTEAGSKKFGDWSQPGEIKDNIVAHACNIDGNGNIYVSAVNDAGKGMKNWIYGALQVNSQTLHWTSWQPISMIDAADDLSMEYNADSSLSLFAFDSISGTLSTKKQVASNSTEWYFNWHQLGSGIKSYAVAKDLTP